MTAALQTQLHTAAVRLRRLNQLAVIERAGWAAALSGLSCYGLARLWPNLTLPLVCLFLIATAAVLIRGLRTLLVSRADELKRTALALEAKYPELQARLLTAVEQRPDVWTGEYNLLQRKLLNEVAALAREQDWASVVSAKTLRHAWWRESMAVVAALIVGIAFLLLPVSRSRTIAAQQAALAAAREARLNYVVDPGNTQVERNQSLLVLLRFQKDPPRDVTLEWRPADGSAQRLDMTKSLDDPVFAGRLASITGDGAYSLEFDGVTTPDYSVTVYDLPALRNSTITVVAPPYTHREPQIFENASSVTVIEGSQIRLECRVNKPLASVELRHDKSETAIPLAADAKDSLQYAVQWSPDASRKWLLTLKDADGRTNRDPQEFQIDVVPNRRPDLKPVFPGQDQRVSALQEIALESRASDDFGILSSGLLVDPAGKAPITVPLTGELVGGEAHALEHLLALEAFSLEPGEVVSYAFFADDHGPDGKTRRTMSDLFFLEIRPFDETYREMDGGGGGKSNMQGASGSPSQNLDKLIDVQKQIVTAAWNLQRRDPDLKLPAEQAAVQTLLESQTSAHEQFEQLSESLAEAVPADRIRTIFEQMTKAIDEFTTLQSTGELKHLDAALQAARGAYQGLVRLRPHDHRMMKGGQSGGGGGGGGSSSQQQMEQLELTEQNRYETEKSARKQNDTSQQKEQLAFLNRLKELAQRQQGLNEKLKELDAELRTAQSKEEREELERQLKQLRDEQQDLLQDADALRNKLEQSKNSDKTADTRKQLEQTRQQLVDATESLKEGRLSQALSSGTRAEKDLQKMQDDFRKKSSAQLADAMQQLRQQAKELTETEERAAKELAGLNNAQEKSLRQRQQREKLANTFQEQRTKLEDALKAVRETVETAEASEPLAAKRLYEAARQAQQQKTEQALNAASQLLRQGFLPEASQVEELASKGLQTLRDGIEEAAESILGDELADLKRAKQELAELSQELQKEMATAQGKEPSSEQGSKPGEGANGKSSESGDKEPKTEGQQPGKGKPDGEGKSGGGEGDSPAEPSDAPESNSPSESQGGEGSKSPGGGKPKPGLRGGRKGQGQSQPGQGTAQPGQSEGGQGGGPGGQGGPLTGGNYSEFVDRLRDVETLLNDPELQAEVSKVREQARSIRADFKRHSKLPNWELVEEDVRQPLVELQRRIAEEIARRESPDALVPTDRDPVPQRYREVVKKYYERLGGGGK